MASGTRGPLQMLAVTPLLPASIPAIGRASWRKTPQSRPLQPQLGWPHKFWPPLTEGSPATTIAASLVVIRFDAEQVGMNRHQIRRRHRAAQVAGVATDLIVGAVVVNVGHKTNTERFVTNEPRVVTRRARRVTENVLAPRRRARLVKI